MSSESIEAGSGSTRDLSVSGEATEPLIKFTLFSKFHEDARVTIWDIAACDFQARQIIVVATVHGKETAVTPGRVPPLLHVNKEARHALLKYCKLLDDKSPVYMSLRSDVLHLKGTRCLKYFMDNIQAIQTMRKAWCAIVWLQSTSSQILYNMYLSGTALLSTSRTSLSSPI